MSRSNAYWAGNRYLDESVEPPADAPLKDLPATVAARFRAVREGLVQLPEVAETVRYMGATWRWAWEYGIGNRKICWIHFIGDTMAATFTVSEIEEDRLRKTPRLAAELVRALDEAQRTGPVKWCWLELADRRAVEVFLRFAARKGEWLTERPPRHRAPRLGTKRGPRAKGDEQGE